MVPRMPLLNLIGLPQRPEAFGAAAVGRQCRSPFDEIAPGRPDGHGPSDAWSRPSMRSTASCSASPTRSTIDSCDARGATAGSTAGRTARRWATAMPARPAGSGRSRCATRRCSAPVLGHLTAAVVPRGAFAMWVGGAADRAIVPALAAGFRLDRFPVLLCWDRPFADFSRYLPISPGLL